MKELTYNVTCNTPIDVKEPQLNMKIKIKRGDMDWRIEDARSYMKKLIILVNKARVPMLFYAADYSKYPKTNFWHVIYKLKHDEKCPYVSLRIISQRADFSKQSLTIQVLDFIHGGRLHERSILLAKIRIIAEAQITIPAKSKNQQLFNEMPLDMSRLLIKRRSKESNMDFIISYHQLGDPEDPTLPVNQEIYSLV